MYEISGKINMIRKKAYIIPFGDIHLSSPNCRLDKFKRLVEWVGEKNVYWVGMGD